MNRTALVLVGLVVLSLSIVSAGPTQQSLTAFAQWVQQHKIHSKYNLAHFEGQGLGSIARTDIQAGDSIVIVPSTVLISNSRILQESFLQNFKDWPGSVAVEPMIVWLLYERTNPNSPWKPYLDILPDSFPTHPLSWSAEELKEGKGTALEETTISVLKTLEYVHKLLVEKLLTPNPQLFPEGKGFSLKEFIWAYQVINTRSWNVKTSEGVDTILVPLADMSNHGPGKGSGFMSEDYTYFQINATEPIEKGEQVYINYGPKSNYDLLSSYGFVLPENPDDSMTLHFGFKPTNLIHKLVEPSLQSINPNYKSIKIYPNAVPTELLRVFRLSSMEFGELEFLNQALSGKAISLKNELKAFRSAISSLNGMLQEFETTIEEDRDLLKSTNLSINHRNAILLRKGQKEIISNVILVLGKLWENILLTGELLGGIHV